MLRGLVVTGGAIALVGALCGLFGPLVDDSGKSTSYFEYEDGLGNLAWAVVTGYIVGAIGVIVAGAMLFSAGRRTTAMFLLVFSSLGLGALAGFTVFGVGWLVLPGAFLAVVAMLFYVFGGGGE